MVGYERARIWRTTWFYRIGGTLLTASIPLLRKASGQGSSKVHTLEGIQRKNFIVGGVPCEWLITKSESESASILYLHGGGGVVGLIDSERRMVIHLLKACQLRALLPDYRLAPENPFPAGLDDCLAVYRWMISNGFSPNKITIAGLSAGGLLTITLLLAIRNANLPLPAAAVCMSPNTDPACSGASIRKNRLRDALHSPRYLRTMMKLYAGSHDLRDPLLTPLYADLHGLPSILIQVVEDELLLDDAVRFSDCAKADGVDITLEIYPHMWHGWHTCLPDLQEANQAIEHIARYLHEHLEMITALPSSASASTCSV
jgi:monoterpene epsilon-lactone hydrolase